MSYSKRGMGSHTRMKTTRNLAGTGLLILALIAAWMPGPAIDFLPESRLWIDGTSSVHDWTCEVQDFDGYVEATTGLDGEISITNAAARVAVEQIECKNGKMNGKTRKALKADEFPMISFELTSLTRSEVEDVYSAAGTLKVAGVERSVEMGVNISTDGDSRLRIAGEVPLLMSDFDVKPPSAMLGVLKTGDAVTVRFDVSVSLPVDELPD